MTDDVDLKMLKVMMAAAGVRRALVKRMSPNDNTKNQPYLARGDWSVMNVIPHGQVYEDSSGKRARSNLKASLDFGWMDDSGKVSNAPHAQLILYPKYPEIRLSGFVRGCPGAPSKLLDPNKRGREPGRILFLGIRVDRKIIAYLAPGNSSIANDFGRLKRLTKFGLLEELPIDGETDEQNSKNTLLAELDRIHHKGWIDSKRLTGSGDVIPYMAPNGGGYTLEAELGVTPNGIPLPDFLNWEIKQHNVPEFGKVGSTRITLMTPEPTGGFYREEGAAAFLRRFGYPPMDGNPDRLNFSIQHRLDRRSERSGLTLTVAGYDIRTGQLENASAGIQLLTDTGDPAAIWHLASLLEHWNRKHAYAAYVPSIRRNKPRRQYRYGPPVRLGEGADFGLFMKALATGLIVWDPGLKVEGLTGGNPRVKPRNQFRINAQYVDGLYQRVEYVPFD